MKAEKRNSGANNHSRYSATRPVGAACLSLSIFLACCADSLALPGTYSDMMHAVELLVYWLTPAVTLAIALGALSRSEKRRKFVVPLFPYAAFFLLIKSVFTSAAIQSVPASPGSYVVGVLYVIIVAPAVALSVILMTTWAAAWQATVASGPEREDTAGDENRVH